MIDNSLYPSYSACVADVLSGSRLPLGVDDLVSEIADKRPLGKAARGAVYRALDSLYQAVPVGAGRYGWLSRLLEGTTYSHPLTSDEIHNGHLLLDELEHSVFFPQFFQNYRSDNRVLSISLFGGPTIAAKASIEHKTWSLQLGEQFVHWLDDIGAENRDDLIITVHDAFRGEYELKARLRELRDEDAIENRNIRLALLAEVLVAEDSQSRAVMPTWDLVARLIGRGFYRSSPPTDDLHYVLHEYSMLRFIEGEGYQIDDAVLARYIGEGGEESEGVDIADSLSDLLTERKVRGPETQENRVVVHKSVTPRQSSRGSHTQLCSRISPLLGHLDEHDELCEAYDQYLENFAAYALTEKPLRHEEFHLLESELDLLLQLEAEFGTLMPEQENRLSTLAVRLFIDPDTLERVDWDYPDDPNLEGPPSWQN